MQRRTFLKHAATAGAAVAVGPGMPAGAHAAPSRAWRHRLAVPEIFKPLADPPTHSEAIVIGTGFGGAVSALRLAEAGVQVTMLERGSRWPSDSRRRIYTNDQLPDGRGFWHRTTFAGVVGVDQFFDDFGGVLDVTSYAGIEVWRGAAVGGGSVVYTAATVAPERRFFDRVFRGRVPYDEMAATWWPKVRGVLRSSLMPADVYASPAFLHSRVWDEQARAAGYSPERIEGNWNWDLVRAENAGTVRRSATIGETNLGNGNGVKQDLTQNYLKYAEADGAVIYPGHQVTAIGRRGSRFELTVAKLHPTGRVLATRTLTCDALVLAAGSIGTSELLVKAKATGTLPFLDASVGHGWGTNGDAAISRAIDLDQIGRPQGAPSASRIVDESGDLPVSFENWLVPGISINSGVVASLGMVLDPTRSQFRYRADGSVDLDWNQRDSARSRRAMEALNAKIAKASKTIPGVPGIAPSANTKFTAHPLGGAVLGDTTDLFGRVKGHPGLYVMDGAMIPGSTGTANPSLTIAALAERNIAAVIDAGR